MRELKEWYWWCYYFLEATIQKSVCILITDNRDMWLNCHLVSSWRSVTNEMHFWLFCSWKIQRVAYIINSIIFPQIYKSVLIHNIFISVNNPLLFVTTNDENNIWRINNVQKMLATHAKLLEKKLYLVNDKSNFQVKNYSISNFMMTNY